MTLAAVAARRGRCWSSFGPAFLRHGLSALLIVYRSAEASSPYSIEVTPGNTTVPRGADQRSRRSSSASSRPRREMRVRTGRAARSSASRSCRRPTRRSSRGCCSTSRSRPSTRSSPTASNRAIFTMTVVDLPTVEKLELEYRYPRLHRPAAAEDRERRRRRRAPRHGSRPAHRADDERAGRADSAERIRLAAADAAGRRIADRQLHDRQAGVLPHRARRAARRERHRVAAVHDRRHRRSAADRVVHEARARHDGDARSRSCSSKREGVRRFRRQAAPAGLRRQRRQREDGEAVRRREAADRGLAPATPSTSRSSGLKPGDSCPTTRRRPTPTRCRAARRSRATSTSCRSGRSGRTTSRRSRRRRGGGGGGGGGDVSASCRSSSGKSSPRRSTSSATRRSSRPTSTARTSCSSRCRRRKLREQVDELIEKMKSRSASIRIERFKKIAELLPKASPEMKAAGVDAAQAGMPTTALSPEQRALKFLQAAEQEYEMQVAAQNGGGGGGGSARSAAERSRRSVRARARQAGEPVPDAAARRRAAGRAEDRRARREAEGAGAAPAAGSGAAAADGAGRPELVGRRRAVSGSWPTRSRRRRVGSSS